MLHDIPVSRVNEPRENFCKRPDLSHAAVGNDPKHVVAE